MESFSFGNFVWWMGVVEDRVDPEKLGRVRVRVFGYHSDDLGELATDTLMWASVMQPTTSAAISGLGTSPTGLFPGTHVVGFFMDGKDAQVPVIMGSLAGKPKDKKSGEAFGDPNGDFPRYTGESDVNRLSRNEKTSETILEKKKETDTAQGTNGSSWEEPQPPYDAKYPYNHVRETESGHVEEWDDTPGKERLHRYHKAGTFEEIHPDGTRVVKVVKDNYTVIMSNDFIHILGNSNVSIDGNNNIKVSGNVNLEVGGNMSQKVSGNVELEIGGNYNVTVGGSHTDKAGGNRKITASKIDLN